MNPGQTSIPHGEEIHQGPCVYCGHEPALPVQIEKARFGKAASNGARVMKRRAVVVMMCDAHRRQTGLID